MPIKSIVDGIVKQINFEMGDAVAKDDVLCLIY